MNIFYFSVHHILEDDEIRLFQRLGHNVFCLGTNNRYGVGQEFRPHLSFSAMEHLLADIYENAGGKYQAATNTSEQFPEGFADHFSLIIVMHDARFIIENWQKMRHRPVVWRTIGQAMDHYDTVLGQFRADGLKIVRYSEVELHVENYIGQDALIRFCKNPDYYNHWSGWKQAILLFSNKFSQRYPSEAQDFQYISNAVPCVLGGGHNEGIQNSIGFVEYEDQIKLFRDCRAYLYMTGLDIPYTLNFIEAWMTGIPVIIYAPEARIGKYYEVDKFIVDGHTGYVCRTIESVVARSKQLLEDYALARRIGIAGRRAAIEMFGQERIGRDWEKFFQMHAFQSG